MKALYRKYRPTAFNELMGQEIVSHILKEAAKKDKLSHAYLFAGPRGSGKTTTARLIAKTANCIKRLESKDFQKRGEPCNSCAACREIEEGRCLDVVEIDAASNRGIDEIRNLKESVKTSPTQYRTKTFIIDEAHQLTKEAWNALLKTLEEPPSDVIIVLATTEFEKVPATIRSRTQQFFFKRVSLSEINKKLKHIAENEKIKISGEALELIASSGEGSFRDSESLLDQLVSFVGKEISLEDVEKTLGKIGFKKISEFTDVLIKKDMEKALESLSEIEDGGFNLAQFTKDIIIHLRRVMVISKHPGIKNVLQNEMSKEHLEKIADQSKLIDDHHLNLLKNLIKAYGEMRYSQFPIIPLEIAIIESLK